MTTPPVPGNAVHVHVHSALGIEPTVFQDRIGGSVLVLEKPSATYTTIMTLGASRLPVDEGLPVEFAVEVLPEQVGAAFAALQIVCDDLAGNRRTPPIDTPWVNDAPVLIGTRIHAIAATRSRHGDEFDTIRGADGAPVAHVRTLRLLTPAEAHVLRARGWDGLVGAARSPHPLRDVTRDDAARPEVAEADGPVIVTKLHEQHPPRWITSDKDGMFTSVTGLETPEYMDDPDNHEIWSHSSLATRFPWVTGFLVAAAPGEVARFDDASGDFVLDD